MQNMCACCMEGENKQINIQHNKLIHKYQYINKKHKITNQYIKQTNQYNYRALGVHKEHSHNNQPIQLHGCELRGVQ